MKTKIRIAAGGGRRVSVELRGNVSVTIRAGVGGVSIQTSEGRSSSDVIRQYARFERNEAKRSRVLPSSGVVSREMQAATVRAFLGGADVTRLGRSLAAVYEAMEAVCRGRNEIAD